MGCDSPHTGILCIHLCMRYFECELINFWALGLFFRVLKIPHTISLLLTNLSRNIRRKKKYQNKNKIKPRKRNYNHYTIYPILFLDRIKTELKILLRQFS